MWFRNDKSATAISSAQIHMHANQRKAKKKTYKIQNKNHQQTTPKSPKHWKTRYETWPTEVAKWRIGGLVEWGGDGVSTRRLSPTRERNTTRPEIRIRFRIPIRSDPKSVESERRWWCSKRSLRKLVFPDSVWISSSYWSSSGKTRPTTTPKYKT